MKKTDLRETVTRNHRATMTTAVLESPRSYRLHAEAVLPLRRPQGDKPGTTPENVSRAFCMPELGSPLPRSLWRQDLLFFLFVFDLLSHLS